jgi:hypothetical protein
MLYLIWAIWAFKIGLAPPPPPLSPHSPLFNFTTMRIKPSSPWGIGEELTTKPSLFQMIDSFHFVYPCITFFIFKFEGLF